MPYTRDVVHAVARFQYCFICTSLKVRVMRCAIVLDMFLQNLHSSCACCTFKCRDAGSANSDVSIDQLNQVIVVETLIWIVYPFGVFSILNSSLIGSIICLPPF